jgi:hypothetical protein
VTGMGRLDRFLKLERSRPADAPPGPAASAAEARFGGATSPGLAGDAGHASRSGASVERFESRPEPAAGGAPLRLLEDDGGPSFVRCGECRADSHATALRCSNCAADLTTPAQRGFNEAFWRRRSEEEAAERVEVERLRESQARAEKDAAEARRQLPDLERQLRSDGIVRVEGGGLFRALGQALGRWLVRRIPDRRLRIAAVAGAVLLVGTPLMLAIVRGGRSGGRFAVFLVFYVVVAGISRYLRSR